MKQTLAIVALMLLISCKEEEKSPASAKANTLQISKQFNDWLAVQFKKDLARDPQMQTSMGSKENYGAWTDISSEYDLESKKLAESRLEYLRDSIDKEPLEGQDKLSYDLYYQKQKQEIANFDYRLYTYPVNQMHGMQSEIPAFLINQHRIDNVADARAYISRLKGIQPLFEQLSINLKLRESNGIVIPRFVFTHVLKDSRNVIDGYPFTESKYNSTLFEDFTAKIATLKLSKEVEKQLIADVKQALLNEVKTGYQTLIAKLEDQQQRATAEDGVWKLPKGEEFYEFALKRTTTTDMTSDEIHQLGLTEVARIHREMEVIMNKVKFEGSLQDFFKFMREDPQFYYTDDEKGKAAYLKKATSIIDDMNGDLDELFLTKPKADIKVQAVEAFREASAGKAFYEQPAMDGSRPGIYYANLYHMEAMPSYQMEALAFHEGIPGHHMQIAIAQELEGIPDFRKHSFYTAYVEGWGLYSEKIPKEIGKYQDPYSDFGRLAMELWRACRLVVDTGIHAKKWTREEGIMYYVDHTPNAESDAVKMVERHIVMPSQATAYKVGMNKILELREKAKAALGDQFDIKEFHDVILTKGALPLKVLEDQVVDYISNKNKTTE
ncbi:DUF885 domain-containing protein [Nonlabens sp. Ci31]|uniref:DUF885 domain-containing protein n=1 Tax=Nonlabens sp. Ci31 TaxID=2608253 RepID=UPI0014629608|nr:DUF885 domain-containing protein [Nonlabens sp. Ci31]QJP34896.1 DUF885 domain-containing protein [Nonlabens sp. Ci31]